MHPAELDATYADALSGRRLLDHPFYRRWEAGLLTPAELAAYAGQYRHFEAALCDVLAEARQALDPATHPVAVAAVDANLADESSHLALFDTWGVAVGAPVGALPTAATAALVATYTEAGSPLAALAALAAYEVQSPEIAATKAAGLRQHYGCTETAFWDLHADLDADHARWTLDAVGELASDDADRAEVAVAARAAADAWWSFLDDRQLAAEALSTTS